MTAKKTLAAVLVILVAIGGFVAGLYLLRQRQELREEAAVPGGQAEVRRRATTAPGYADGSAGHSGPMSLSRCSKK